MKADDLIYKLSDLLDGENDDVFFCYIPVCVVKRVHNKIILMSDDLKPFTGQMLAFLTINFERNLDEEQKKFFARDCCERAGLKI